MIIDGRYYTGLTGETKDGNEKYSAELKQCIERAGEFCLEQISEEKFDPCMFLGSIQSGKTRGFIGLMALCFDNDFDMAIIMTKCSKALVQQTVKRMTGEFERFKAKNATISEVVAQDILDIDFTGADTVQKKQDIVAAFLNKFKGKKRILVVKKEKDNVDRMNMLIKQLVEKSKFRRLLIIDDEADVTSVGYEKVDKDSADLSLRRISGSVNTARRRLRSNIEYAVMQVTATPYALYLQPEIFGSDDIMPIKPGKTIIMPTGEGYIGGKYYFIDSVDEAEENYSKAKYLPYIVKQEEMSIINGTKKNSGKNSSIKDRRTLKPEDFIKGQSVKSTYALPAFRKWVFDILVGAAIIQSNEEYRDYYVSAVMHAATTQSTHKAETEILDEGLIEIKKALKVDIKDKDVRFFAKESYDDLKESVYAYNVLNVPSFEEVMDIIAFFDGEELDGLIAAIDLKEVNSKKDITKLLDDQGELRLENRITIFVGGQVLDRGITIPNMINFFYGRDPKTMQQDTVIQHCRMLGYRSAELLSVTRFYTTNRLFNNMREITIRDEILRARIAEHQEGDVIYMEAGGDIKPCGPAKIRASEVSNILPRKRYLPVGFDLKTGKREAVSLHNKIEKMVQKYDESDSEYYREGESIEGKYSIIDSETAKEFLRNAYSIIEPKEDGICNKLNEIEPAFDFSISELLSEGKDEVALIVRHDRHLGKTKHNGMLYQDAPDDGNNEGALAKVLRQKMPVLLLTEQKNPEWGYEFWWPVYYTPERMNIGIYAERKTKAPVNENLWSVDERPVKIKDFVLVDRTEIGAERLDCFENWIRAAKQYYESNFAIKDAVNNSEDQKSVDCRIYLEDLSEFATDEYVDSRIERLKAETVRALDAAKASEKENKTIISFFDMALERMSTEKVEEAAVDAINALTIKKVFKDKLFNMIEEVNNILHRRNECFGMFLPVAPYSFEIHIYCGTIEFFLDDHRELLNSNENFDEALDNFIASTIAHEMFHAIHYADVMTTSGRWLYARNGYRKQIRVQESLAEYFNLCCSREIIEGQSTERIIRSMRNINDFPEDEYAGALVLEKAEEGSGRYGNKNPMYVETYINSLSDMYAADKILEGRE